MFLITFQFWIKLNTADTTKNRRIKLKVSRCHCHNSTTLNTQIYLNSLQNLLFSYLWNLMSIMMRYLRFFFLLRKYLLSHQIFHHTIYILVKNEAGFTVACNIIVWNVGQMKWKKILTNFFLNKFFGLFY